MVPQSPGEGKTGGCRPVKKTGKSMFNLIEITMAIAVVGIGIAAIMALFPPAIEANRVANTENYIGGIVDSMAAMIENLASNDWTKISSLSTTKATPNSNPFTADDTTKTNYPGIYSISGSSTLFGVKSEDGSFIGHLQIWKEGTAPAYENPLTSSLSMAYSAKVFIELSWPVTAPYDNRKNAFT